MIKKPKGSGSVFKKSMAFFGGAFRRFWFASLAFLVPFFPGKWWSLYNVSQMNSASKRAERSIGERVEAVRENWRATFPLRSYEVGDPTPIWHDAPQAPAPQPTDSWHDAPRNSRTR